MMYAFSFLRSRSTALLLGASALLVSGSVALLFAHVERSRALQTQYLTLAQEMPEVMARIRLKEAYLDTERILGAEVRARLEEQASALVLPRSVDSARVVRSLSDIAGAVAPDITVVSVTAQASDAGKTASLRVRGPLPSVASMLAVLRYGGYLTVGDVLGERTGELQTVVEEQAPLALPAAEQLLRTELAVYASQPDAVEEQFLGDLPGALAPDVRAFLLDAGLGDVRTTLTPHADALRSRRLWPLPFTSLASFVMEGDDVLVTMVFHTLPAPAAAKESLTER